MNINDIQKWEREFSIKKGIAKDEEKSTKIAVMKLIEEVGEVCKAILEKTGRKFQQKLQMLLFLLVRLLISLKIFMEQKI